ncbi:hypothetical protein EZV62_004450 [Acer yangbiense]|uniref:Uncharacterized protein n=1 Tax=Acer yangbiense TaxID=1000413 RepID=A0A5C7IK40_9ROSI|nr:hypothetical protein EZV62_004450 [Acer yangbiense]
MRSGETVSRYFHNVLHSVIRLHGELLKPPEPVPENSTDESWSHKEAALFKLKSFPYYEKLFMMFGKDRATRQHAETQVDVEEQLQNEEKDYKIVDDTDFNSAENVNNSSDNNVDVQFVSKAPKMSQSQIECSKTSKKQRKSKSSGDLDQP